ncbi:MAG: hypothetical protein HFK09_05335 [Clostridia bacterium]|nr:hypothetical protein [Clostridia bacterium]
MTVLTVGLISAEWGSAVKTVLIAAVAFVLAAVLTMLVFEIVGRYRKESIEIEVRNVPSDDFVRSKPIAEKEVPAVEESEKQKEEEVKLEEAAVLVDDGVDAESGTVIVGETRLKVGYNRSFTAKLIQSDDTLKSRYSELYNEFLRYELKSRMSWSNESLYRGRKTYAKFAIRGKTLSLYLALRPSEFAETKYGFKDAGNVAKYKDVPMRLKIKSARGVRWAKELIAVVAEKAKWKKKDVPEANYRPEYQNTTTLVREGYIKLYYISDAEVGKEALNEAAAADLKQIDRTPRDFTTKLMRASLELKTRYSAVKNELLRYGMKSRMSIANESLYRDRTTYAKFAIRGKTLFLHIALNPEEFIGTKYNFRNMGDVGKYGAVPMRVKLKSDRSVRWVKELIATMAEKKGWQREELEERDFRYVEEKRK